MAVELVTPAERQSRASSAPTTNGLPRQQTYGRCVTASMVRVELKPSRHIAALLAVVHGAGAVVVVPLDLPLAAKLAIGVLVLASFARAIWHYALLRGRHALTALDVHENGEAAVRARDGEWRDARILGTSYVSPSLSAINLRLADACFAHHILLVTDNCDPEAFRRMRVHLRWGYQRTQQRRNAPSPP